MLHVLLQPHGSANCKHVTEALTTAVPVLYAQGSLDIPQALTSFVKIVACLAYFQLVRDCLLATSASTVLSDVNRQPRL